MAVVSSKSKGQLVTASIIIFLLSCLTGNLAEFNRDIDIRQSNIGQELEALIGSGPDQLLSREKLNAAGNVLAKILLTPWPEEDSPIIYLEEPGSIQNHQEHDLFTDLDSNNIGFDGNLMPISSKRSKYYRKFPWKRQKNMRYEPAYICEPNKDDIYRLLVAIRDGSKGQMVDFCNKRRPVSTALTNVRFVG